MPCTPLPLSFQIGNVGPYPSTLTCLYTDMERVSAAMVKRTWVSMKRENSPLPCLVQLFSRMMWTVLKCTWTALKITFFKWTWRKFVDQCLAMIPCKHKSSKVDFEVYPDLGPGPWCESPRKCYLIVNSQVQILGCLSWTGTGINPRLWICVYRKVKLSSSP